MSAILVPVRTITTTQRANGAAYTDNTGAVAVSPPDTLRITHDINGTVLGGLVEVEEILTVNSASNGYDLTVTLEDESVLTYTGAQADGDVVIPSQSQPIKSVSGKITEADLSAYVLLTPDGERHENPPDDLIMTENMQWSFPQ